MIQNQSHTNTRVGSTTRHHQVDVNHDRLSEHHWIGCKVAIITSSLLVHTTLRHRPRPHSCHVSVVFLNALLDQHTRSKRGRVKGRSSNHRVGGPPRTTTGKLRLGASPSYHNTKLLLYYISSHLFWSICANLPPSTALTETQSDGFRTHQASVPHPMAPSLTPQATFDEEG